MRRKFTEVQPVFTTVPVVAAMPPTMPLATRVVPVLTALLALRLSLRWRQILQRLKALGRSRLNPLGVYQSYPSWTKQIPT